MEERVKTRDSKRHRLLFSYAKLVDRIKSSASGEINIPLSVLKNVIELAVEIAREGREGRKIGTIFTVGGEQKVIDLSHPLILDPLAGHASEKKKIADISVRETIKELSQLDGAFIISRDGEVISATRYLDARKENVDLPLGLGSRHVAAASISRETGCVAIVVSESAVVRIILDGKIIAEILPELWLFHQQRSAISDALIEKISDKNITFISPKE
ncbi:MAG: diadenylate cyclase [Calditrichaeota bacterium]|nr:diadenylate cyclase [Calditrichota bacterium]